MTICAILALAALQAPGPVEAAADVPGLPRVLFLTHSAGFTHDVVRRAEPGRLALAERQLAAAARHQFAVDATQDCAAITAANLARYAAVVFYTTGELPLSDDQRAALIEFVRAGGGFAGAHSATDTLYEYAPYGELVGGYFDGHPWHQEVRVLVERERHPAVAHLGDAFEIRDEIYQFKGWSRDRVRVLLRLDGSSVDIGRGKRKDGDYALAWCADFGRGRMFYTALGHRAEVWTDQRFLRHLVAGIRWTMAERLRRAPARATVWFDGEDASRLRHENGAPCGWKVRGGALEIEPGSGSVVTARAYRDFRLHVEFRTPEEDRAQGQGKGNSGIYLQRRYEVQILDSFGRPPERNGCGSLYRQRAPDVNASREPGEWQSYDIVFRAARFDDDANKTQNARITVVHNGVLIHADAELTDKTGAGRPEGPEPGPVLLQDHGNRVQFRNFWIVPIDA